MAGEKPKKKKKRVSPTQKSLAFVRKTGYVAAVVERWNPFVGIRQDLFGWIDIIAIHEIDGFVGIQTTTKSNMNARLLKAWGNPALERWLRAGGKLSIHGWAKNAKGRWEMTPRPVLLKDLLDNPQDLDVLKAE